MWHAGNMSDCICGCVPANVCGCAGVSVCVCSVRAWVAVSSPEVTFCLHGCKRWHWWSKTHAHTHTHAKKKKIKKTQLWSAFGTRGMLTLCVEMVNESSVFAVASLCIHCATLTAGFCSGNSSPKILITSSPFFFHECLAIVSLDIFVLFPPFPW